MIQNFNSDIIKNAAPLAEKMRPKTLNEFIGQKHILGKDSLITQSILQDKIFSMILWGPPGCGKTTLARIIAKETKAYFTHFSAVLSGIKEIRKVIELAKEKQLLNKKTILFVDEIHRFNKAQQDAFLHHVESGLITLIGATTENPSFEVINALLSRCKIIVLNALLQDDIKEIISLALSSNENGFNILYLSDDAIEFIAKTADGDARLALNNLEIISSYILSKKNKENNGEKIQITLQDIEDILQKKAFLYDKNGDEHYNLISAFHKSLRGSDPDAALYWLQRMLLAGEDPFYIARRMVRFASEDIGNADANALTIAINSMEAFKFLGHPEGDLALAQAVIYLATAPKSNSVYEAFKTASADIKKTGSLPVPMHIRNAPTKLTKNLGYGKNYKYAHNFEDAIVAQDYLPKEIKHKIYYHPTNRGYEKTIKDRLDKWRKICKKI